MRHDVPPSSLPKTSKCGKHTPRTCFIWQNAKGYCKTTQCWPDSALSHCWSETISSCFFFWILCLMISFLVFGFSPPKNRTFHKLDNWHKHVLFHSVSRFQNHLTVFYKAACTASLIWKWGKGKKRTQKRAFVIHDWKKMETVRVWFWIFRNNTMKAKT